MGTSSARDQGSPAADKIFIRAGKCGVASAAWRRPIFGRADVVVAVGCRFSSWLWDDRGPLVRPPQKLININIDYRALGHAAPHDVAIQQHGRAIQRHDIAVQQQHPVRWRVSFDQRIDHGDGQRVHHDPDHPDRQDRPQLSEPRTEKRPRKRPFFRVDSSLIRR